jgi:hypothetical protein
MTIQGVRRTKAFYLKTDKFGMIKQTNNQILVLAILSTILMGSVVYSLDWPENDRQIASESEPKSK